MINEMGVALEIYQFINWKEELFSFTISGNHLQ